MYLAIQEHWLYFGNSTDRLTCVNFDVDEFCLFHGFSISSRKIIHDKCNVKLCSCVFKSNQREYFVNPCSQTQSQLKIYPCPVRKIQKIRKFSISFLCISFCIMRSKKASFKEFTNISQWNVTLHKEWNLQLRIF